MCMVIVVDNCRYDVGCKKTFNNFKKKNKVFLKITSTCSKLYIYSISKFFGGLFLLFLFPTGCVHSQFKSTKVIFIKVGRGHTKETQKKARLTVIEESLSNYQIWRSLEVIKAHFEQFGVGSGGIQKRCYKMGLRKHSLYLREGKLLRSC